MEATDTVEKKRWLIAALVALLALVNNMVWLTFGSIVIPAMKYYKKTDTEIDFVSLSFMITALFFMMPGALLIDKKGMRLSIIICAAMNILGTAIRSLSWFMHPSDGYWVVLAGSAVVSLGQPILLTIPPKLAAVWFPNGERTIATSIGSLANLLGMAVAFVIGPLMVTKSDPNFNMLLLVHTISALVTGLLAIFLFKERPFVPPSSSAEIEKDMSFQESIKTAFKSRSFVILLIGFGIGFGVFSSLFGMLDQVIQPQGYTPGETGVFGVTMILSGIVGATVFGVVLDYTRRYKETLVACYLVTGLGLVAFFATLFDSPIPLPQTKYSVAIACGLVGFSAISILPAAMEAGVEVTYPVPEATVTGILILWGNAVGAISIVVMNILEEPKNKGSSMVHAIEYTLALGSLAIFSSFFFTGPYKRLEYERGGYTNIQDTKE